MVLLLFKLSLAVNIFKYLGKQSVAARALPGQTRDKKSTALLLNQISPRKIVISLLASDFLLLLLLLLPVSLRFGLHCWVWPSVTQSVSRLLV